MSISKEKRTQEQAIRLLDRAIEQEEALLKKVKTLEDQLSDCRKRAENPRHELDEQALPGSKVSFRLDYYRTEKKGPYKGIIEHLPTRESRSFEGNHFNEVGDFIAQFVGRNTRLHERVEHPNPKAGPTFPPSIRENTVVVEKKERSPLLKKLFPHLFGTLAPTLTKPVETESNSTAECLEAEPFIVLTEGAKSHQRSVHKGQPFQIEIPMQELDEYVDKPCRVILSAESLEKTPRQLIKMMEDCIPKQETLRVPIRALPLDHGVYRLVVSMNLRDEPKKPYYKEGRLLIIQ